MGNPTLAHVFLSWDPNKMQWLEPEVLRGPPMRLVRLLLHGEWTRSAGRLDTDMASAFWNDRNSRKVLVIRIEACVWINKQEASLNE